jgi:hypothetical protein
MKIAPFALVACSIFSAAQSTPLDSWSNLNKITHKRAYRIETRDLKCTWAEINNVSTDALVATVRNANDSHTVKVSRAEVLFVSIGSVYYSGRSSWSDVAALSAEHHNRLEVITNSGKTYRLKSPYKVTDEGITLQPAKDPIIPKGDISQLYEILPKPLTARGEFLGEELGPLVIFDPDLYKYSLHLEGSVTVIRFDASQPEDNTPAQCSTKK